MVQRSRAAQCNVGNVSQGKNLFLFFRESLFGTRLEDYFLTQEVQQEVTIKINNRSMTMLLM